MFHKEISITKKEKTMRIRFKKLLTGIMKTLKNNFNTTNLNKINGFKI